MKAKKSIQKVCHLCLSVRNMGGYSLKGTKIFDIGSNHCKFCQVGCFCFCLSSGKMCVISSRVNCVWNFCRCRREVKEFTFLHQGSWWEGLAGTLVVGPADRPWRATRRSAGPVRDQLPTQNCRALALWPKAIQKMSYIQIIKIQFIYSLVLQTLSLKNQT